MTKRISAIDALRGLAILGMVLSGNWGWGSGIPGWCFHCQVPPPDYVFDPSIRGITWVDVVFPFFLFSLGAALPLSLGKRISKGESLLKIYGSIIKRWLVIAAFGLVLGYTGSIYWHQDAPDALKQIYQLAVWGGMFMGLVRIKDPKKSRIINLCGLALTIGLVLFGVLYWHRPFDPQNNNIIIMVMSSMVLFGGVIWLLTRNKPWIRFIVWLVALGIKALCYYTEFKLPTCPSINWLFNWRYMQYLGIVLPASFIGEMLANGKTAAKEDWKRACAAILGLLMLPLSLWGFYTRNIAVLSISVFIAAAIYVLLTKKERDTRTMISYLGFLFLLAGVGFDPLDGGIAKDHATISYFFANGGLAMLLVSFFMWLEAKTGKAGCVLPLIGQNPMIAYTIGAYLIYPIMLSIGLLQKINQLCPGNLFWGLARGFIITALTALGTALFTKKKIYWRS